MNPQHWFLQLFISLDQLLNLLVTPLHGGAWADETLSCRAYRMHRDGKPWGRVWMPAVLLAAAARGRHRPLPRGVPERTRPPRPATGDALMRHYRATHKTAGDVVEYDEAEPSNK
jgi:hypothetical protein